VSRQFVRRDGRIGWEDNHVPTIAPSEQRQEADTQSGRQAPTSAK
jgi:hypothetical protein